MVGKIRTLKWRWAGHVARMQDNNRWTNVITSWYPRDGTRKRGKQETRWQDDIVKAAGANWERTALDRQRWKTLEETFVLQWTVQADDDDDDDDISNYFFLIITTCSPFAHLNNSSAYSF